MSTNDWVIVPYVWNDTLAQYEPYDRYEQTGIQFATSAFIPLLPMRRIKVTIKRTSGVGANTDYAIQYDLVKQTG